MYNKPDKNIRQPEIITIHYPVHTLTDRRAVENLQSAYKQLIIYRFMWTGKIYLFAILFRLHHLNHQIFPLSSLIHILSLFKLENYTPGWPYMQEKNASQNVLIGKQCLVGILALKYTVLLYH